VDDCLWKVTGSVNHTNDLSPVENFPVKYKILATARDWPKTKIRKRRNWWVKLRTRAGILRKKFECLRTGIVEAESGGQVIFRDRRSDPHNVVARKVVNDQRRHVGHPLLR